MISRFIKRNSNLNQRLFVLVLILSSIPSFALEFVDFSTDTVAENPLLLELLKGVEGTTGTQTFDQSINGNTLTSTVTLQLQTINSNDTDDVVLQVLSDNGVLQNNVVSTHSSPSHITGGDEVSITTYTFSPAATFEIIDPKFILNGSAMVPGDEIVTVRSSDAVGFVGTFWNVTNIANATIVENAVTHDLVITPSSNFAEFNISPNVAIVNMAIEHRKTRQINSMNSFKHTLNMPIASIVITKSAVGIDDTNMNSMVDAGDTINYSFIVSNTGEVDLSNVVVTDSGAIISGSPIASLLVGATNNSLSASHVLTSADVVLGTYINQATVVADVGGGISVTDLSDDPSDVTDSFANCTGAQTPCDPTVVMLIDICDPLASGNLDSDLDGVTDICDNDDDNDGILDINEGCFVEINDVWEVFGVSDIGDRTNQIAVLIHTSVPSATSVESFNPLGLGFWSEALSGVTSAGGDYTWGTTITISFFDPVTFLPIQVEDPVIHFDNIGGMNLANQNSALLTLQGGLNWTQLTGTTDFLTTATTIQDAGSGSAIGVGYSIESSLNDSDGSAAGSVRLNGVLTSFDIIVNQASPGVGGTSDVFEIIVESPSYIDSDGDGIKNCLDVDSDNDLCPDAIEGAGVFMSSDINIDSELIGGIDMNGIPLVASPLGQANSADVTNDRVNSCDFCTLPTLLDSDMDEVNDICDLDSDNDGILDSVEGRCRTPIQTENWTLAGTTATYDMGNGVIVKATTTDSDSFTPDIFNPNGAGFWSDALESNASIIGNFDFGSQLTISFEDNIGNPLILINPIIHIDRIGFAWQITEDSRHISAQINLENGLTWTTLQGTDDFETTSTTARDQAGQGIVNTWATSPEIESTLDNISGTAAGSLRINGSVSSFTMNFTPHGTITGWSGGGGFPDATQDEMEIIISVCNPDQDTDNDGTPDYLDSDSDGDGCNDADEAYGAVGTDSNNDGTYGAEILPIDVGANGLVTGASVTGNVYNTLPATIIAGNTFQQGMIINIDTAPTDQNSIEGSTATFTATASTTILATTPVTTASTDVSYLWQLSTDGGTLFNDIGGATGTVTSGSQVSYTTPILVIGDNNNVYRVVFTNEARVCPVQPIATLSVIASNPSLSVSKPAPVNADNDFSGNVTLNDVLTYTITATNTGNVTLSNVVVNDPMLTPNSITCTTVAPLGICVLTGTYTVQQSDVDAGVINNTATADSSETSPINDSQSTNVVQVTSLIVDKPLPINADNDLSGDISVNDVLTYTITATNNGTTTLTNVIVSDSLITPNSITCVTLSPGAACVLVGTYQVQQSDVDNTLITNTATAQSNQTSPVNDSVTVPTGNTPGLSVNKPVPVNADNDSSGTITLNDVLTYIITATNTGTTTLTNVLVNDPLLTPNSIICPTVTPNSTCVLTGIYTVQQSDVDAGVINNTAIADSDQTNQTSDSNSTNVVQNNSLIVNKAIPINADNDSSGDISLNDVLTYTITATNNGTITLTNVIVNDTMITPSSKICATLAPAATCVLVGIYQVQQSDIDNLSISNTATAESDQTNLVTDSVTVPTGSNPGLNVVKSIPTNADNDNSGTVTLGDVLTYTITATNTGSVTLTNVVVNDPILTPNSISCALLAPNANCSLSGTYTVQASDVSNGEINNTATANSDQTPQTTDTVTTLVVSTDAPAITLIKSGTINGTGGVGDTIAYIFVVTNTGNVTLTNITITDNNVDAGSITYTAADDADNDGDIDSLAVNASATVTAMHTINASDVFAGRVTNTATAIGHTQNNQTVSDVSDSTNPNDDTGGPDDPTNTILGTSEPILIPILNTLMLIILMLFLITTTLVVIRKRI